MWETVDCGVEAEGGSRVRIRSLPGTRLLGSSSLLGFTTL